MYGFVPSGAAGRLMPESVLVTGGAGYIGSHAVLALLEAGFRPVVLDDLSTGQRWLVPSDVDFVEGNAGDIGLVAGLIARHRIGTVMHFAGSIVAPESVAEPLKYYRNNTGASRNLIEACVVAGVNRFVFSSTAAVYGAPDTLPVAEDAPTEPINPYGTSKLMTEWILRDVAAANGLNFVTLRYFNVAGADPDGRTGQATPNATHLIKVACETVIGKRPRLVIFGDDYDTADGTCIRDYIHVTDLAAAHVLALQYLVDGGGDVVLNCGYGRGYSVKQVVDAMQAVAGQKLPIKVGPRRAGDAPELVADATRIRALFGWKPRHHELSTIVASALAWERKLSGE